MSERDAGLGSPGSYLDPFNINGWQTIVIMRPGTLLVIKQVGALSFVRQIGINLLTIQSTCYDFLWHSNFNLMQI